MQRWQSPWIVCITPPPPPLPPPSPPFKSADNTHTLRRWLSIWLPPLQPEYRHSFLCAAELVLLGLCSDGWVDFKVLWIISTVTVVPRVGRVTSAFWWQHNWGGVRYQCFKLCRKTNWYLSGETKLVLGDLFSAEVAFTLHQLSAVCVSIESSWNQSATDLQMHPFPFNICQ